MRVFDDFERTDMKPSLNKGNTYSFLNRSGWEECKNVRDRIEDWFSQIPNEHKSELLCRMKDRRDKFEEVYFEMFIYQLLISLNYIVTIHPDNNFNGNHPDFLAELPSGEKLYVETTVIHDKDPEDNFVDFLQDELNKCNIYNFGLAINDYELYDRQKVSFAKLRKEIEKWAFSINSEDINVEDNDNWPIREFENEGMLLEIELIPLEKEKKLERPCVIGPGKTRWGGSEEALRTKLKSKAAKYGEFTEPYIIAVNNLSPFEHDSDVINVLYNGFWQAEKNTRVSAILHCIAFPWHLENTKVALFHNYYAKNQYKGPLDSLGYFELRNNKPVYIPGMRAIDILKL